ncbi:MAG: hypothetical protein ACOYBK_06720, partial [Bilifractor sp.]
NIEKICGRAGTSQTPLPKTQKSRFIPGQVRHLAGVFSENLDKALDILRRIAQKKADLRNCLHPVPHDT